MVAARAYFKEARTSKEEPAMKHVLRLLGTIAAPALAVALLAPPRPASGQVEGTSGGEAPVKPDTNPLCALDNSRFHVDFLSGESCCPNELEFWVEDRETGRRGPVRVETTILRADKMILVAGSKIFVTGYMGRGAQGLAIVDLETGALQDEIHSYDYRLSPSARKLVYSRLADEPPEERRPLVLLYDLAASREANRAGSPAELGIANAGVPVYPESNARLGSYEPQLEPPHRYLSAFVWSDDETRLTFFEKFDGKYWLVILDFSEGASPAAVRKKEVALAELVPGAPPDAELHLVTLHWKGEDTVEVEALVGGVFHDGVEVVVPRLR